MSNPRVILGALLFVLTVAMPLEAQQARRNGQWLGFGVGTGLGRVSCPICEANRHISISGYVRGGGTLSRRLLLGAEVSGWTRSTNNVNEFLLAFTPALYWYPNVRRGLYYKGGVAVMLYQTGDGPNRLTSTAFGPHVGAGLDVALSPSVSLTPFANWIVASLGGELKFNGEQFRNDIGLMLIQVGFGFTWH